MRARVRGAFAYTLLHDATRMGADGKDTGPESRQGSESHQEGKSMIKELVKDEAVLSKRCAIATAEDAAIAQDVVDTLASLEDAACLAANQIGQAVAVGAYLDDERKAHVLYNPKVIFGLGAARVEEGCLTRDEPSKVTRYAKIKLSFDELVDGELVRRKRDFVGWEAQMIQHIADHCAGKLV